jgi:hypothetical protein
MRMGYTAGSQYTAKSKFSFSQGAWEKWEMHIAFPSGTMGYDGLEVIQLPQDRN